MPDTLRAGPVTMMFEDDSLRYIRVGQYEILRQVYTAVRDHNWGTIPGEVMESSLNLRGDHFSIEFTQTHHQGDIHFISRGKINGSPDGTITFEFEGKAKATFRRNRIGFCVLHPMDCAGVNCTVEHVDGTTTDGIFPRLIAPHQPFFDIRAITHEVAPGLRARVLMEGDTFEMEDQRNWTDASYKTYCTPLSLPFPVTVNAGDKIWQKITITLEGDIPEHDEQESELIITAGAQTSPLPGIGLCANDSPLLPQQENPLSLLNLSHLRVDVHLSEADWLQQFRQCAVQAQAIKTAIELAIFVSDNAEDELQALRPHLDKYDLARIMLFHEDERSTRADWVHLARTHLGDLNVPIGTGTDAFFTELNRERPPTEAVDFVTYSLNPQVHAFDNASLVETLATQAVTVESARSFASSKPIIVSPVTFKMRWNPAATGPDPEIPFDEQLDRRQTTDFGAAWTLGSIKYLAQSGVDSITYYQTIGALGVMSLPTPSPFHHSDDYDSVYPMYYSFQIVNEFASGEVVHSTSSDHLKVDGLILKKDDKMRVILMNFTTHRQQIKLANLPSGVSSMELLPHAIGIWNYTI